MKKLYYFFLVTLFLGHNLTTCWGTGLPEKESSASRHTKALTPLPRLPEEIWREIIKLLDHPKICLLSHTTRPEFIQRITVIRRNRDSELSFEILPIFSNLRVLNIYNNRFENGVLPPVIGSLTFGGRVKVLR